LSVNGVRQVHESLGLLQGQPVAHAQAVPLGPADTRNRAGNVERQKAVVGGLGCKLADGCQL
jgi:hypothetical protein